MRAFFAREQGQGPMYAVALELWAEAARNDALMAALRPVYRKSTRRLRRIIEGLQQEGTIDPHLDAGAVAQVIRSLHFGFILQRVIEPRLATREYLNVIMGLRFGPPRPRE